MVSLFGTASETCWEIADRAPYAYCVRCRCARGCHTCEALGASTARMVLWGSRHAGSKGNPQKSSMRRMTPSGSAASASYCAPPSSRRAPARTGRPACAAASNWRASTLRALVSKGLARVKATPRFSPPPSGGRPEGGWGRLSHRLPHPHWYVAPSVGRAATSSPIAGDRSSPSAAAEAGSGSLHHLCRCHKSTSRLT